MQRVMKPGAPSKPKWLQAVLKRQRRRMVGWIPRSIRCTHLLATRGVDLTEGTEVGQVEQVGLKFA